MTEINARLTTRAYIANRKVTPAHHHLVLQAALPGTCNLIVPADANAKANDIVAFEIGWGTSISRAFLGYVDRVMPQKPGYVSIFCRELAGALTRSCSLRLRHPTMRQVLDEIGGQTGLTFIVPDAGYAQTAIPCFYADSSGIAMLDNIGRAFQVPDFIWQQQGDGRIYVGSYADSGWQGRQVTIPGNLLTGHSNGNSAKITVVPKLRPNVTANGKRIRSIEVKKTDMVITW